MALGCLRDDATMMNDNSNRRRHRILSACGGFHFSWKSVARGALHPFFAKTPHFPLNQIKLPLRQSPSRLVFIIIVLIINNRGKNWNIYNKKGPKTKKGGKFLAPFSFDYRWVMLVVPLLKSSTCYFSFPFILLFLSWP
jgi:hypothetical protein